MCSSDLNLTGDMLVKVDRMSMANSLEVRCPLLDHELAEFAATIPLFLSPLGKATRRKAKHSSIFLSSRGDARRCRAKQSTVQLSTNEVAQCK